MGPTFAVYVNETEKYLSVIIEIMIFPEFGIFCSLQRT